MVPALYTLQNIMYNGKSKLVVLVLSSSSSQKSKGESGGGEVIGRSFVRCWSGLHHYFYYDTRLPLFVLYIRRRHCMDSTLSIYTISKRERGAVDTDIGKCKYYRQFQHDLLHRHGSGVFFQAEKRGIRGYFWLLLGCTQHSTCTLMSDVSYVEMLLSLSCLHILHARIWEIDMVQFKNNYS